MVVCEFICFSDVSAGPELSSSTNRGPGAFTYLGPCKLCSQRKTFITPN